jgi:hypothetical protein
MMGRSVGLKTERKIGEDTRNIKHDNGRERKT